MDWTPILLSILPIILTFSLGLVVNKPGYKKSKAVIGTINRAIADDKIDSSELEEFLDHFKKNE